MSCKKYRPSFVNVSMSINWTRARTYRWLPLHPSQRKHPLLHRGAASYRLPLLLVGKAFLREDHLLGLMVGGQIKKEEVKEGREDGGLVAVSDQNDRRRVIPGMFE